MTETTIVGFDSAWTDKVRAPGAVCAIRCGKGDSRSFVPPRPARFGQALEFIAAERGMAARTLVALDQPTIVPNATGSRPVDKVAAALVSWVGGGVQPANRSKVGMFDDTAPVRRFKEALGAIEEPENARIAADGLHLIEVFPALALPSLVPAHCGRKLAAKYNPGRRTFQKDHWANVTTAVAEFGAAHSINGLSAWAVAQREIASPAKSDQDLLDAALCSMIGYLWLFDSRDKSLLLGDLASGYMVTPAIGEARQRLLAAAARRGVPAA